MMPGIPVPSETTPGKTYFLIKGIDGRLRCTCPSGFYRAVDCKHITAYKAQEAAKVENPTKASYPRANYLRRGSRETLSDRYRAWRAGRSGSTVYAAFVERAMDLRQRGFRSFGAQMIVENIRWDHAIKVGPDGDGFKINNSFAALMARDAMAEYPALKGLFELRVLRAN